MRYFLAIAALFLAVPASAQMFVPNKSGGTLTNVAVTYNRQFPDTQIPLGNFSQPYIAIEGSGTASAAASAWQTPIKNARPDGLSTTPGWHKISYSELVGTENTSPCPPNNFGRYGYNYAGDCSAVYNAWSGAAMDTKRHRLVIWGGGHTDYAGNEVYALDLTLVGTCTSLAPCLYRLDNPSPPNNTANCVGTLSDGRPNSRHTYDGLAYDAVADALVSVGGALNDCGNGSSDTWTLAMSSVIGSCAPAVTNSCGSTWTLGATAPSGAGGSAELTWDSGNHVSQFINPGNGNASINRYNASTNAWTSENQSLPAMASYYGTAVYDPNDQIVIHMGCGASCGNFWTSVASKSSYAQTNFTLDSATCSGLTEVDYPPITFDPVAHAIRFIPNGSNTQFLIHPNTSRSTWLCTSETYGSTLGTDYPPPGSASGGIFGRYAYDSVLDVFAYCEGPTQDCWYLVPNR